MEYFDYCTGLTMTNEQVRTRSSAARRASRRRRLTQREMDLARSIQDVTEEVMLRLARTLHARDRGARTSAWPAASRSTAWRNGRLLREGPFDDALDPARRGRRRRRARRRALRLAPPGRAARARRTARATRMRGGLLGPAYSQRRDRALPRRQNGARTRGMPDGDLFAEIAGRPRRGQGRRLVPGPDGVRPPRARRPLASSATRATPKMQSVMNLKIKYRESFRPFAPSVLARARRRLLRAGRRQPLHAARRAGARERGAPR